MHRNDIYDGQFRGNIFIVGKMRCGKTYFMQKLAINNFFGDIVKAEWVSSIELTLTREAEIQSTFSCDAEFHYPQTLERFGDLIEDFKLKAIEDTKSINEAEYGEDRKIQRLIVMDDVSGLADRSNTFTNFLTVARKFGYHCVYIFRIILPEKEIWKKVISQTTVFNIFPLSVPYQTVVRLLQSNVVRTTTKYLPARSLWINKPFIELANDNEKTCLTTDCSGVNKNGPGRFRTEGNNLDKQVCYFNGQNNDQMFNVFTSTRINKQETEKDICFQIDRVRSKTNEDTFEANTLLRQNGPSKLAKPRFLSGR